jgi:hypothetical protein
MRFKEPLKGISLNLRHTMRRIEKVLRRQSRIRLPKKVFSSLTEHALFVRRRPTP